MPVTSRVVQALTPEERDIMVSEMPAHQQEMSEIVNAIGEVCNNHTNLSVLMALCCFLVNQACADETNRKVINTLLADTLFNPDYESNQKSVVAKVQELIDNGLDPADVTQELVQKISDELHEAGQTAEGHTIQ